METNLLTKEKGALIQVTDTLSSAVEMLEAIARGETFQAMDYHARVTMFKLAIRNVKKTFRI